VSHVRAEVNRYVAEAGDGLRLVVWDLSASSYVDIAGVRLLSEFQRTLAARGVTLRIVDALSTVRELIRLEMGTSAGEISRRISIDDAIAGKVSGKG
jgi:ABC-type transporter Mla MlaB component